MKLQPIAIATLAAFAACQVEAAPKRAEYKVKHQVEVKVPAGAQQVSVWMPLPQDDQHQKITDLKIECPHPTRVTTDSEGNKVLYVAAEKPAEGAFTIATTFGLARAEHAVTVDPKKTRPLNDAEKQKFAKDLAANANIVMSQEVKDLSASIVGGETNPVLASKKLYDWTLENIDYWVKKPAERKASPVGSSEYCLSTKTGNCTDFHSLYAALSRSAGIPTRILYGSFLKKELDGKDTDQSYHCWIEFYAPEIGWIPLDVAIADIFVGDFEVTKDNEELVRRTTAAGYSGPDPKMVSYYFGNLEDRRVLWSVGRDLQLDPPQKGGPVNALPKAYVEIDGKAAAEKTAWTRKLTYTQAP